MTVAAFLNWRLSVGLLLAVALDTAVQFFSKTAVISVPDGPTIMATLEAVLDQPLFLLVIALMLCQLINWLLVLQVADVSFAKPFTSLSYVTVAIVSALFLDERLHPLQIVGIAVIILGVWCVARTEAATTADDLAS
jgi:drug/metabolite transporter (DMT)-like permease